MDFKNDVFNDVTCSSVTAVAIMNAKENEWMQLEREIPDRSASSK
jgi:hypothetical protein